MTRLQVLISCPPMLAMRREVTSTLNARDIDAHCPEVSQTLSENELIDLVPRFDAWIIGDDPATRRVFDAGSAGRLRAAVKWGVGVDNVDFDAARSCGVKIDHTPGMFGREVADVAMGYVVATSRHTFQIDRAVRNGQWLKIRGNSLADKLIAVVGFGDIGRNVVKRVKASDMNPLVYDPGARADEVRAAGATLCEWPARAKDWDYLVLACALNEANRHLVNESVLNRCKQGLRVINVARGPLIDEPALIAALASGRVAAAALDVFEDEPLAARSRLREFDNCIFGSHNASNTQEAVTATNARAIDLLCDMLGVAPS